MVIHTLSDLTKNEFYHHEQNIRHNLGTSSALQSQIDNLSADLNRRVAALEVAQRNEKPNQEKELNTNKWQARKDVCLNTLSSLGLVISITMIIWLRVEPSIFFNVTSVQGILVATFTLTFMDKFIPFCEKY